MNYKFEKIFVGRYYPQTKKKLIYKHFLVISFLFGENIKTAINLIFQGL